MKLKRRSFTSKKNIVFGQEIGKDFREGDRAKIFYWDREGVNRFSEIGVLVFHPDIPLNFVGSIGVKFPNGEIIWEDIMHRRVVRGEWEIEYFVDPVDKREKWRWKKIVA